MSRSGYCEDIENWALIRWRGAVASAIRGRCGQAFLREMVEALDALPKHELISGDLVTADGDVCAIGAVCQKRGLDTSVIDPYDRVSVASALGIAKALAAELAYENDEGTYCVEDPAARFKRMRQWAAGQIVEPK